ncbi:MAG: SDR family NAD(P)-dependent oxidoreductase [Fluviicola sp.]|nr:SDR family NAD(P)-dependent oxidoreductase [Fluviicola sp.]
MEDRKLSGWNNRPLIRASVESFTTENELRGKGIRGNGRSYGDACLNDRLISMLGHRETCSVENGELTVSSGFLLKDVVETCVRNGCFFPVIPGTQFVTVGGMVAADVHGKNHPNNGTIGRWIKNITLQLPTGETANCSPTENSELFHATIGGMGLTGLILEVCFHLEPLKSTRLTQQATAFTKFNELVLALDHSKSEFAVGWLDFLNRESFLLLEADFTAEKTNAQLNFQLPKPKINIPKTGINFVYPFLMKIYNQRYKRSMLKNKVASVSDYFFPLDNIGNWNRLYGRKGFIQYQFVLPKINVIEQFESIFQCINAHSCKPLLAVLKRHGDLVSPGIVSFPLEGYSLALDFRFQPQLTAMIAELDELVTNFGGRIYLAKDHLLQAHHFERMYPSVGRFKTAIQEINPSGLTTLLGKRLNLVPHMKQQIVIIGANSEVGILCAHRYRDLGYEVVLVGHKPHELPTEGFQVIQLDLLQFDVTVLADLNPEMVLFTAGRLGDNDRSVSGEELDEVITVNFTAQAKIASFFAMQFKKRGHGVLVGVSSVAAVRGKASTVVYGAAKAGFDTYLSGMRNYLYSHGVRVLTIRPGFINSKMTAHMPLPAKLTASPAQVADTIVRHSLNGKRSIVYVKAIWRPIMFIIRHIPEPLFKKMKW